MLSRGINGHSFNNMPLASRILPELVQNAQNTVSCYWWEPEQGFHRHAIQQSFGDRTIG